MPSSVVRSHVYDPASGRLVIRFVSGRAYAYAGVPPEVAAAFAAAPSQGAFFNAAIRDVYPAERLRGVALRR